MILKKCGLLVFMILLFLETPALRADTFGTIDNQFTIDFVNISGASNPTSGYGIVNNNYRMGKLEITNDQWNKFKASLGMPVTGSPLIAYTHEPVWTEANVPVNNISWRQAAQFVNWLNISTGHHAAYNFTGTQGTDDYSLTSWSPAEASYGTNLYRHKDAFYFLPSEDEWVKAGYWNGTTLQTFSNSSPADLIAGLPDPSKWNWLHSNIFKPWDVGSGIAEINGTFDMMGNVYELMENPYTPLDYGVDSFRSVRGGAYNDGIDLVYNLSSYYRDFKGYAYDATSVVGFRVASIPEPGTISLLVLGGLAAARRRKA